MLTWVALHVLAGSGRWMEALASVGQELPEMDNEIDSKWGKVNVPVTYGKIIQVSAGDGPFPCCRTQSWGILKTELGWLRPRIASMCAFLGAVGVGRYYLLIRLLSDIKVKHLTLKLIGLNTGCDPPYTTSALALVYGHQGVVKR